MKCFYCHRDSSDHDDACPEELDTKTARVLWTEGWQAGKDGKPNASPNNATYTMGFRTGESFRSQNSVRP